MPVKVPVLLFCAGLATASTLIFGLSPALSFSRPRLTATARTTAGVNAAALPAVLAIVAGLFAGLAVSVGINRLWPSGRSDFE